MNNVPLFITLLFIATTLLAIYQLYKAANKSKAVLIILTVLLLLQGLIGLSGFYQVTMTIPPRFVLLAGPGFLFIALLCFSKRGRAFIDSLDLRKLTLLHTVRIPVEITLYYLFVARLIPEIMTFEGKNYDIFSGITAPLVYYMVFVRKQWGNTALLVWNFICFGLLLIILTIAILSAQTPFQQLAFEQPNIGVAYFPFVWLPGIVVPIVFLSHVAAIRQLLSNGNIARSDTRTQPINVVN